MSNNSSQKKTVRNDEIDLNDILNTLILNRILIFSVTVLFALSSIVYSLNLTNQYRSEAIMSVAGTTASSGALSGLNGLAGLTGISLPMADDDKSVIAIQIVESRGFLRHLITFEGILPSIMAAKSYDSESQKIQFDPEIYDYSKSQWIGDKGKGLQSKPSYLETYDVYMKGISILKDLNTNLITISFEHISPVFAKEFLELIIRETNQLLRNQDLKESSDAIEFLLSEIPQSSLMSMKNAINQLVLKELETQMMAKVSTEYVFKIIEPPFVPEKKSRPSRALIVIAFSFLGGVFVTLWVLVRRYFLGEMN